jgi:basic membrane protein A
MHKRLRAGWFIAFLVAAVAVLAVAAAQSANSKVTAIAIAAPDKANNLGWDQQGVDSAKRAAKALGIGTVDVADGIGYENTESVLRQLAQKHPGLIIAQASGYNTIAPRIAQQFNVPVLTYDNPKDLKKGLVADISTTSQQGAYLAGILAGKLTKTGTIGVVISAADTNWYKQTGGYIAGARSVNPDVKIRFATIGQAGYGDAAGGKRVTQSVIAAGADIVFGMGDGASFGMLQAVQTASKPYKVWFIDVIGDKSKIDKKGVLLSSVIWDFTKVFKQAIFDINGGKFGTHNYNLGVKNGIYLLKTKYIPADVWAVTQQASKGIISGNVTIPLTPTKAAVDKLLK